MKTFNLPDLGEGLPDAEIVRWLVKEGDTVTLDQPMVEMETAKAVVEVPSPFSGVITRLLGKPGDVIDVGAVLVEFDGDTSSSTPIASTPKPASEPAASAAVQPAPAAGPQEIFKLPDLGEGLPDAEIVRWLVSEGDSLTLDQPMVEMETAKAVVEVPSPHAGVVARLHGAPGDVIEVGAPLVTFGTAGAATPAASEQVAQSEADEPEKQGDAGTVVGAVQVGNQVVAESASAVVKALAKKLKVDLTKVIGTGKDGNITQADVKQAKKDGKLLNASAEQTQVLANAAVNAVVDDANPLNYKASPAVRSYAREQGVALSQCIATGKKGSITKADIDQAARQPAGQRASAPAAAVDRATTGLPSVQVSVEPQTVRGVRRAMAMGMAKSHATVVPTTLMEDADITAWPKQDSLARYVRALVYACKIEPALNCWFDGEKFERLVHPAVHVGLAVDSPDGLYVPVIFDADKKNPLQVRERVQELREKIETKSLKQEDQQGATITLSNYGSIAGRYGTPVVSPPQVAILGTGRFRNELKLTANGISQRKILPLSLTFDHRACTGGEAARFLSAVIEDLQKPQ
ncbi:2-oxo acid dehydrogenase subunit E2 [Aliikangiella maris]|uniref:Dihydrolipoamide acetyltransferase component of pyruvate dehydrogenase complex n=2 Tax=Aliikangiella maris TaxID=3162458 RepID=A0ABV3MRH6_9GAMM